MIWWILLILLAVVILAGLPHGIDVSRYEVADEKIATPVKIAVLADLHCRPFGKNQKKIMEIIDREKPDLVVIPGDLFDTDRDYEISFSLINRLKEYLVYFTTGNHDTYLPEINDLEERLKEEGVRVLEDASDIFACGDTEVEILGMSDHGRKPVFTPEQIEHMYHTGNYRILISHRPGYTDWYRKIPVDLILCGHAHGGQFRIPFTHQGIIAPQQGLFPKYTEGKHDLNGRTLIISRGLASGDPHIPRLYNNPEIVIVTLKGD
jgi:predicted MPP superfamily phosphohydrolase